MKNEDTEKRIVEIIISEVNAADRPTEMEDLESSIDMLEGVRNDKEYEWMSDYNIPEGATIILTDASNWTSRYFPNRDFVEVKIDEEDEETEAKCKAVKLLINKTLNARYLNYYLKYNRARFINSLGGMVWAFPRWEQEIDEYVDEAGNTVQTVKTDRFNYDVPDPRNVFPSPEYAYTAQEKKSITVRDDSQTLESLMVDKDNHGYFNLDKVKEALKGAARGSSETDTSRGSYNKDGMTSESSMTPIKSFDVYTRYGKIWAIIKKEKEVSLNDRSWKEISEIDYGYDEDGQIKEKAVLTEAIVSFARIGSKDILIRFQPTPYYDCRGNTYKAVIRGLCYPHPLKDTGLGDGKYLNDLQVMLNDTFNLGYDRQRLAMLPTLKGKKHSLHDNDTIFFAPEHVMELESPGDIEEVVIRDNIQGTLMTVGAVTGWMDRLSSVTPPRMGSLPDKSGTTATSVVNAENNANVRSGFKDMTFEYTFNCELYWMINQMSYRFMQPSTAQKLLGDLIYKYDPDPEYTYTAVSSNIETEYNKNRTMQIATQLIQITSGMKHPGTPKMLNYLFSRIFELYGDRFPGYKNILLNPEQDMGGGATFGKAPDQGMPQSNQNGMDMSNAEMDARSRASERPM